MELEAKDNNQLAATSRVELAQLRGLASGPIEPSSCERDVARARLCFGTIKFRPQQNGQLERAQQESEREIKEAKGESERASEQQPLSGPQESLERPVEAPPRASSHRSQMGADEEERRGRALQALQARMMLALVARRPHWPQVGRELEGESGPQLAGEQRRRAREAKEKQSANVDEQRQTPTTSNSAAGSQLAGRDLQPARRRRQSQSPLGMGRAPTLEVSNTRL